MLSYAMAMSDVMVCASFYEAFPRTLLEALALERPVVATSVGGIPEIVVDGETGILAPAGDPDALAAAVLRLLKDRELRSTAGRRRTHSWLANTTPWRRRPRPWPRSTGRRSRASENIRSGKFHAALSGESLPGFSRSGCAGGSHHILTLIRAGQPPWPHRLWRTTFSK